MRTATVQVDLGYAAEQAVVPLIHPNSRLVEATMRFPLGLVLESELRLGEGGRVFERAGVCAWGGGGVGVAT